MATYKVLQDIEAEDTLIGPLTLRQCLYAAVAVIAGYLSFLALTKHATILVPFLLPFVAFGVFFAFPWSKQQTTEVWALAKVRFYLKPRKRIWNQSGVKELVTITVPKTIQRAYASNLTPTEVKSRLRALADTIDSRGWAVKNVDLGYYTQSSLRGGTTSDRLLDESNLPKDVPNYDAATTDDIFDVNTNPVAQKFDTLMTQSASTHRQQIVQQMADQQIINESPVLPQAPPAGSSPYWHLNPSDAAGSAQTSLQNYPNSATTDKPVDIALQPLQNNNQTDQYSSNYSVQQQPGQSPSLTLPQPMAPPISAQPAVTAAPNPAILELANNNDLNVATIAREAHVRNPEPPSEVVISFR